MPLQTLHPDATLLVVDVQALTLGNARAVPADVLIKRISKLANGFRASGRTVASTVTTGVRGGPNDLGLGARDWPSEALALPDALRPFLGDHSYARAGWSAFAGTALEEDLRSRGSSQIVVTGIATSFGVESTVRAAYDLGFDVVVPMDAVSDPDLKAHAHALEHTFPILALTTSTSSVLRLLLR